MTYLSVIVRLGAEQLSNFCHSRMIKFLRRMEEDDIDQLFEPQEDPSNVQLPPPPPPPSMGAKSAKKRAKTNIAEQLKSISSEKGKMQKLAEIAAKNAPPSKKETPAAAPVKSAAAAAAAATTTATAPKKSASVTAKVKGGVIETGDGDKVIPLFPHPGDLQRLEMMLFRTVESAWRAQLPDSDERKAVADDELEMDAHAEMFNTRCAVFSRQLKFALVKFFTENGNTAMANVVDQMPKCILTIFPQPKFLHPDKPAVCIWSGKVVPEVSLVRSIALIPKKAEDRAMAASFHMHRDFLPILKVNTKKHARIVCFHSCARAEKAIYTTMFFARIIFEKQTSNFAKITPVLGDWKEYFAGWLDKTMDPGQVEAAKRENTVAHFVGSSKMQLCKCIDVLRQFLPQETFIVKTAE